MGQAWRSMSYLVVPAETRRPVAEYRAVVGLDVERSDLTIAADVDRDVIVAALQRAPEWCPIPWPRIDAPTDQDLRRLALLKLRLFFDFGARLPGETADEIREALWQHFPALRRAVNAQADAIRLKRYPVEATIWSDGEASGGYSHPGDGEHPPIGAVTWDALDLLIKNLVRSDIRTRLAEEDHEWQSFS